MLQPLQIKPIGIIKNDITDADSETTENVNWNKIISEIHIDETLAAGLTGLEDWSHVVVIFSMHQSHFVAGEHLVRRPNERDDMPPVGIFAQRARFTPNTIGVTAVRLLGVAGHVLRVKGLDAIDGTPVLDIKPYAPIYDGANDPLVPEWFVRLMQGYNG